MNTRMSTAKFTDIVAILNFRSSSSLQHNKNGIQGTIDRMFIAVSDPKSFDIALNKKSRRIGQKISAQMSGPAVF